MRLPERVRGVCARSRTPTTRTRARSGSARQVARPGDTTRLEVAPRQRERMRREREPRELELRREAPRRRLQPLDVRRVLGRARRRGREAQRVVAGHALAREDRLDLGQQREQLVARGRAALLGDAEPVERADADERLGRGQPRHACGAGSRRGRGRAAPPARARSRRAAARSSGARRAKPTRIARPVTLDGVARVRLVDVRRQDLDAVPARVVDHAAAACRSPSARCSGSRRRTRPGSRSAATRSRSSPRRSTPRAPC